jgi:outer membrane protein TolC
MAFDASPALRRAAARVRETQAARDQIRATRLPQLSVGAFDALRTVNLEAQGIQAPVIPGLGQVIPTRVGPFSQVDARAFLNQEILNFSQRYRRQAGNTRMEVSAAEEANARELLALNVVVAYVNAQRAQASAATLHKQLSLARELLTLTTDRFSQGVASSLEVKRSQQQVNNLQQTLFEVRNSLTTAKLELANVIHAQVSADYELAGIASFYDRKTPAQADALALALQSRPDYRAAEAQVRAAELEVRGARSERYPTLSFAADYGQSGKQPFSNLNTFRIQGSLNIPVYLGGRIKADALQAESRLEQAQALLDEVRSQVETDVLTALGSVESAQRQVDVAESTIRLAQEEVDLSIARFTGGVTDNTEVVNAQDRLARAEDNRIRALFNLHIAGAGLERAIGAAEKTYRQP